MLDFKLAGREGKSASPQLCSTRKFVNQALKSVKYPGYSRDIVSFGIVKNIAVNAGAVSVSLQLTGGSPAVAGQIKAEVGERLSAPCRRWSRFMWKSPVHPGGGRRNSVVAANQVAGN
jgi:hypothetical protein